MTNQAYQRFVDAGAYRNPQFWKQPFQTPGGTLHFDEAMARFRDMTGRPGPASWELGTYPEGQRDYPVRGISWLKRPRSPSSPASRCRRSITGISRPVPTRPSQMCCGTATSMTRVSSRRAGGAGSGRGARSTWRATSRNGVSTRQTAGFITSLAAPGTSRPIAFAIRRAPTGGSAARRSACDW